MSESKAKSLLMNPDPFQIIVSTITAQPFVTKEGRAYIYIDEEFALEQKLDYLRLCGYHVEAGTIETNKEHVFDDMYFAGVSMISVNEFDDGNDALLIDMNEIVSASVLTKETDLMNRKLTFALNYYYEMQDANLLTDEIYEEAMAQLQQAEYFIPIHMMKCQVENQIILPFMGQRPIIPIFSDIRLMGDYVLSSGEDPDAYGPWKLTWEQMKTIMTEHPEISYCVNCNTVNLMLDRAKFE